MIAHVRLASGRTLRCRECRRPLIIRLYLTRHDGLPIDRNRDSGAKAGFVPNVIHRITCSDCFGEHPVVKLCPTCGGRGYTEERFVRDPYDDPLEIRSFAMADDARIRDAALSEAIVTAERDLGRFAGFRPVNAFDELADANGHPYGWEVRRRAMYARFDYAALDRALERLHLERPGVAAISAVGLRLLDGWMPDRIRAPQAVRQTVNLQARGRSADPRALEQRDAEVRRLAHAGVDYGEIAATVGLSAPQLRRIINGRQA